MENFKQGETVFIKARISQIFRTDKDRCYVMLEGRGGSENLMKLEHLHKAPLFEAAPDILAALEACLKACASSPRPDRGEHIEMARAAIAKAKGES